MSISVTNILIVTGSSKAPAMHGITVVANSPHRGKDTHGAHLAEHSPDFGLMMPPSHGDYWPLQNSETPKNANLPSGANSETPKMRHPYAGATGTKFGNSEKCTTHAPKIVRRCVPIRGAEQPAAVLLHPSTA